MRIHAVLRLSLWIIVALFALVLAVCITVLFINHKDQPPSSAALAFQARLQQQTEVPDLANGYIFLMGLSAPDEVFPQSAGVQRIAWVRQQLATPGSEILELPGQSRDLPEIGQPAIAALFKLCLQGGSDCAQAIEQQAKDIPVWLRREAELLKRYDVLLGQSRWRETLPINTRAPSPPFRHAMDAQRLYLLNVWLQARQGNAGVVKSLLERDLAFWRRVMADSSTTAPKTIASVGIRRHFMLANLALRQLPANRVVDAIPAIWSEPISARERSMAAPAATEWYLFDATMKEAASTASGTPELGIELPPFANFLARHLLQIQDASNQYAERFRILDELFALDYATLPAALGRLQDKPGYKLKGMSDLGVYNPVGDLLVSVAGGAQSLSEYGLQVADTEGVRRAALLMAQLRGRGVKRDAMAAQLQAATLRNPYDGQPFAWDSEENSLVFVGLAPNKYRKTAFLL